MKNIPDVVKNEEGTVWSYKFSNFEATVFVPIANEILKSDLLNYGFISPYILVFTSKKLNVSEKILFSKEKGFTILAKEFATSVVFIDPLCEEWENAPKDIFAEIITNSKIHEYYEDGYVKNWNRFANSIDGYYIRGAIFRTFLCGFGKGADYIAKNCLNHFNGDGLWGKTDIAPVTCVLDSLSVLPNIQCDDIPIISYGNSKEIDSLFKNKCRFFIYGDSLDKKITSIKDGDNLQLFKDYFSFAVRFRRMNGELIIDENLYSQGLIREANYVQVITSKDNLGDDKGSKNHKIGYFAFYNEGLFEKEKVPLVLGFHGGGDSCFFLGIMAGWLKICHRHDFLLVTVENHLNSTATEMLQLIDSLKQKYPIDETRIYSTGFSMGGIKTWDLIQEYPNSIVAAAPMDATVDVGENVYFKKIDRDVNRVVPVPIFYAGGEISPLPELPFQEQKCINRMKYALNINKVPVEYDVLLNDKENWKNKIWGIDGDFSIIKHDNSRNGDLTMQLFKNEAGKIYNVFASISEQGHDCREHTCEFAWEFMSQFRRNLDGTIEGGEEVFERLKNK